MGRRLGTQHGRRRPRIRRRPLHERDHVLHAWPGRRRAPDADREDGHRHRVRDRLRVLGARDRVLPRDLSGVLAPRDGDQAARRWRRDGCGAAAGGAATHVRAVRRSTGASPRGDPPALGAAGRAAGQLADERLGRTEEAPTAGWLTGDGRPLLAGTCGARGRGATTAYGTSNIVSNAPRRTRTPSLLVRSQALYPVELWALSIARWAVLDSN